MSSLLQSIIHADIVAREDEIADLKRVLLEMSGLERLLHTKQEQFDIEIAAKESEIESNKREMLLIIQEKEASMRNLEELASELKANVIAKEDEIKIHKKEMGEMLLKKEANIRNLQKLASELKANVIAKEDEIENHKKELKDVQSRLEKLLQEKRRQESRKTCLGKGVEALEEIQNWVCMVLLIVIGFCIYRLFKYVDYYYSQ